MSKMQKIMGVFLLSIVGLGAGWLFRDSINIGICLTSEPTCINAYTRIGNQLFYGMGSLALVFLTLFFIPSAFDSWKKFAKWFVPVTAFIFVIYPEPGSGDLFAPYPEQVYQWLSGLYVIISLVIITRKSLALRKRRE